MRSFASVMSFSMSTEENIRNFMNICCEEEVPDMPEEEKEILIKFSSAIWNVTDFNGKDIEKAMVEYFDKRRKDSWE